MTASNIESGQTVDPCDLLESSIVERKAALEDEALAYYVGFAEGLCCHPGNRTVVKGLRLNQDDLLIIMQDNTQILVYNSDDPTMHFTIVPPVDFGE